ncbi:hypothetical protein [Marinobacterium aestuariivivens]|uniref:Porin n=1 Tax=Marinobacterium aestuariivivens TaxID=1698799 RepID=A0ABW1ZUW1_9GAMM
MSLRFNRRYCQALVLPLASAALQASGSSDELRISGFLTQGYFHSDHNNIYGPSEDGSFDFREVGVNASWRVQSSLRLAGQLMSRRAGEVDDGSLQTDYLLLDWRIQDLALRQTGLRLGRLKVPLGLYNDTRDVAFTRPSILLPQEIYYDMARDLALSVDGAGVYYQSMATGYQFDFDLVAGLPKRDRGVEYSYLHDDHPGRFDSGSALIGRLLMSDPAQRWKAGLSLLSFELDYEDDLPPVTPLAPDEGTLRVDIAVLSAQYSRERWTFASEYMWQHIDRGELGGLFSLQPETDLEAWYLQAQYRFATGWDLIARYGEGYIDRDDRSGRGYQQLLGGIGVDVPAYTRYAKDLTLGVGWQPSANWLLRAEWHLVRGTLWLPRQDNPEPSGLEKNWNLHALQATYRF